jgi:hypothetical protein
MRRIFLLALAIVWVVPSTALAQWDAFPNKNMPRTPDGKVNMNAPPQRMADGKPDFRGFWMPNDNVQHLLNLATGMKPEDVPLTAWGKSVYAERIETNGKDHPGVRCLPSGIPEKLNIPDGLKVVDTPDLLVFLYESRTIYRQVFKDGRPLPKDAQPTWMGYSVGRWEGDTLVVESTGFDERTYIMPNGWFHSDQLRVIERYSRPSMNYLIVEVTVDDPKVLTKPWKSAPRRWTLGNGEIYEFYCTNNRELEELEKVRDQELQKK